MGEQLLARPYAVSVQAVHKHLKVLEEPGLVSRREAQPHPVRPEAQVLDLATAWLERYRHQAEERHRRLDDLLQTLPTNHHEARHDDHEHRERQVTADPDGPRVRITRKFDGPCRQSGQSSWPTRTAIRRGPSHCATSSGSVYARKTFSAGSLAAALGLLLSSSRVTGRRPLPAA